KYTKSLSVAAVWVIFALSVEFGLNREQLFLKSKGLIFVGLSMLLLICDTLLLDYRDRVGDRKFGIRSYPTSWDGKFPYLVSSLVFIVIGLAWIFANKTIQTEAILQTMALSGFAL